MDKCVSFSNKRKQSAAHFQAKMQSLIRSELINSGKKKRHEACYFCKNNPSDMKHCFAFNHAVIENAQNLATSNSFKHDTSRPRMLYSERGTIFKH